ncbi:MAG: HEPN domain-containing protein [Candidatus Micrarchaeota archaeon]|nr:HEPN domain-containing protein [Candidatus Micrarchaeota archaeon]
MEDFRHCIENRGLVKTGIEKDLVEKELKGAEADLVSAKKSLAEGNEKWATVQCYYAVFHAAKALVLSKGFREKSHGCLLAALNELFVKQGFLDRRDGGLLEDLMRLRWAADYRLEYPEKRSLAPLVEEAAAFIAKAKETLEKTGF